MGFRAGQMSKFLKATLLSLGLTAGATAAYAQTGNIAALPPHAPAATVVVPSGAYPGPDPGRGFYPKETQSGPAVPSPQYVGPKPSSAWYAHENQTRAVEPSPQYIGPKPH
jgi:hypothetical protein